MYPNVGAVWFLMSLVVGRIIYAGLQYCTNNKYIQLVAVICFIKLFSFLNNIYLLLLQLLGGTLFTAWIMVGNFIRTHKDRTMIQYILYPGLLLKLFVLLVWTLCVSYEIYLNEPFSVETYNQRTNIVGIMGAISGIAMCWYVSMLVYDRLKTIKIAYLIINAIKSIGNNTLYILAVHSIDITCLNPIYNKFLLNNHPFLLMFIRLLIDVLVAWYVRKIISRHKKTV